MRKAGPVPMLAGGMPAGERAGPGRRVTPALLGQGLARRLLVGLAPVPRVLVPAAPMREAASAPPVEGEARRRSAGVRSE